MSNSSKTHTVRRTAAAADQIDALVGMGLEAARLMHAAMRLDPATFDFDAIRDSLYHTAAAAVGTNSKADRYRALARRGIHSSASRVDNSPPLLPCEEG